MEEGKRRFPAPWYVHQATERAFEVLDANGLKLATVHFRPSAWAPYGPGVGHAYKLTEAEARAIAKAIARLPEFLGRGHDRRWCLLHPIIHRMLKK